MYYFCAQHKKSVEATTYCYLVFLADIIQQVNGLQFQITTVLS